MCLCHFCLSVCLFALRQIDKLIQIKWVYHKQMAAQAQPLGHSVCLIIGLISLNHRILSFCTNLFTKTLRIQGEVKC